MVKVGFLNFKPDLFKKLIELAAESQITQNYIEKSIISLTEYTNNLLNLTKDSVEFEINVVDYEEFDELYSSIHDELPKYKNPTYLVAGYVVMKDPDVPGYISFSLPKDYLKNPDSAYSVWEFLVNAAHERFERYLLKETIIAKVYEKAREDYHEKYTYQKEKNIEAFILYTLNKDLIPLQETITYAVTYLVKDFLEKNYEKLVYIHLPLIEREFNFAEKIGTLNFIETQFRDAQINMVGPEIAYKRFAAGLEVLRIVTEKFQDVCADFLRFYPVVKSSQEGETGNFFSAINQTIQKVLQKYGLSNLMNLYKEEYAKH